MEEKGILHLCNDQQSLDHGRKINGWLKEAGLNRKEVSIDEMVSIEPTLNLKNFVKVDFIQKVICLETYTNLLNCLADASEKKRC